MKLSPLSETKRKKMVIEVFLRGAKKDRAKTKQKLTKRK